MMIHSLRSVATTVFALGFGLGLGLGLATVPAQDSLRGPDKPLAPADLDAIAEALIEVRIPRQDSADALITRLLDVAYRLRGHDISSELITYTESLWRLARTVDDRTALEKFLRPDCAGPVIHQARYLQGVIDQHRGRFDPDGPTFVGYATHLAVIGPFGDNGNYYTGVPFPPERSFPGPQEILDGRFSKISTRLVTRRADRYFIRLGEPRQRRSGCFYALHQFVLEAPQPGYIRLWCHGSFELFVNGEQLAVVDRAVDDPPVPRLVPVVLRSGNNHVLVKTTDNEVASLGLSYLDAERHWLEIKEPTDPLVVRPFTEHRPLLPRPPDLEDPAQVLAAAAASATGYRRNLLLLAAAAISTSATQAMRRLDPVWRDQPDDPRLRLALATLLRRMPRLPESIRRNAAHRIEAALVDALPGHHALFMRRIDHLVDEDKPEQAIRRLRQRLAAGGGGPSVYQRLAGLYRDLGFMAEQRLLFRQWLAAHPQDVRPYLAQAGYLRTVGHNAGALRLLRTAARRHLGQNSVTAPLLSLLADLGMAKAARALLAQTRPRALDPLRRLRGEADLARRLGEHQRHLNYQGWISRHAAATTADLSRAAAAFRTAGRADRANRIERSILQEHPDDHDVRRRLAIVDGRAPLPNLVKFRRTASDAIAEFKPTAREAGASTSLLIDHMIVEVFADGSHVQEVHTLRRINDQAGVEGYKFGTGAANADEVITVRTIGTDGKSYVPNLVDGKFSMPRLSPGAMIEQRYRDYHAAAPPAPWRITKFYFQSADSPFLLSELVLILPPGHASLIRRRRLPPAREVLLTDGKTAFVFTVENSPRLPTEIMAPPLEDVVPMLAAGYDGSRNSEVRRFRHRAHRRAKLSPIVKRQATKLVAGLRTDREKATAIHAFVHQTIEGARGSPNPTAILMLKKGPRFFLETALLKAAKIPFSHALCANARAELRTEGQPFYADTTPYQVPCLRVEPRGDAPYWLFADSPRHFPIGLIPANRYGAEVVLADPATHTTLPDGPWHKQTGIEATGTLSLDRRGAATLQLDLTLRGGLGLGYAESIRKQPRSNQQRVARSLIGRILPGWTFVDASPVDLEKPGPLRVTGTLRRRSALEPAGDKFLLALPLPPSRLLQTYGGRGSRTLPMRLHRQVAMDWRVTIDPGPAFEFRPAPAATSTDDRLLRFELDYRTQQRKIIVSRRIRQRAGEIEAADFVEWRALLQRLDRTAATNLELVRRPK